MAKIETLGFRKTTQDVSAYTLTEPKKVLVISLVTESSTVLLNFYSFFFLFIFLNNGH